MKTRAQRKTWTAVVAVLTVLMGVASCGDDEKTDDGPPSAAPTAPAPQASGEGAPAGSAPAETDEGPDDEPDENMVGGLEVDIASFPWVAALRTPGKADNFCGGALVGTGAVMTAAHCVTQRGSKTIVSPTSIEVVLGRTDLNETGGQVVGVSQVWVVKDYQPVGLAYDFAVLQLEEDVDHAPIALPTPGQTDYWREGQNTLTLGWGCESGNPPGELCTERTALSPLKAALLKIQAASVCTAAFGGASPTALCMRSTDQSAGICQGDSGGPWAVYDDARKPYLVGITSFNHKDGECSPAIPQGAAFVAYVTNDQRWFKDGIWDQCASTEPCPVT